VHAIDVEGGQPLVDEPDELQRQRRLFDVVVALEEINGVGVA